MISPASGIHRPSNNGAPAKQTLPASKSEAMTCSVMLHPGESAPCGDCVCDQRTRRICQSRSNRASVFRWMMPSRNCERLMLKARMALDLLLIMLVVFFMRCM